MSISLQKIISAALNPVYSFYHLWEITSPETLLNRYVSLSRRLGLNKLYFVLSFDCDTEDDIKVASSVHARLQSMGVTPVYAVPGDLLRRGEAVYRRIHESGSQFINHGDIEHTYYDEKKDSHLSCFFYEEQSFERIRKDIVDGHQALKEVLGVNAQGFRTPHFGTFQKRHQLQFIYSVLNELNYTFSTSTVPLKGLREGAVIDVGDLKELPVSGGASRPLIILDSWGYFSAPDRVHSPQDYFNEATLLAEKLSSKGVGIINIYADPSHIYKEELFFQAVETCLKVATPVSYNELLEII